MSERLLYPATVFVWGTATFMIDFQVGEVPVEVSIMYRFLLGAALVAAIGRCMGLSFTVPRKAHLYLALQGLLCFSFNFLMFYKAAQYIPTGMISVGYSTLIIFNALFACLIFARVPRTTMLIGAAAGTLGVAALYMKDLSTLSMDDPIFLGLIYVMVGTASSALGQVLCLTPERRAVSLLPAVTWSMAYGAGFLMVYCVITGTPFVLDTSVAYLGSLAYLVLFGAAAGTLMFFRLIKTLGPDRVGYMGALFPVVALTWSWQFEGFEWTPVALVGLGLVVAGSILVLNSDEKSSNSRTIRAFPLFRRALQS